MSWASRPRTPTTRRLEADGSPSLPESKVVTGSHLIGKALQLEGVTNVFALAGDHVLPVMDVMADMGFRFIDTRHEQAAVHMADAWGRITGQPGVAMYTTPGFANAIPGLSSALNSEAPLLSISGSAPLHELGRGAMQEIEQVDMARPVTKGAWLVTDPRRIPHMIAQALRLAYSGRRGPVHLTIPIDVQQAALNEREVTYYQPSEYRTKPDSQASPAQIEAVIEALRSAERPLIVAGAAAAYSGSGEGVRRLVETTRIPIMTEAGARGLVPDDHPYCAGFYDNGLNHAARKLRDADAVLLLGMKQDIIIGYALPPTVSPSTVVLQVDPSPAEVGRNRGVAAGIVGDVATVADQLAALAARHTWREGGWGRELRDIREAQLKELDALAVSERPMHAIYVHKALRRMLRRDDFLTFEGGDFCHFGRAYLPAMTPRSWHYFSALGMLGAGLPTAIAAKLAYPDRRAVSLTGDGSFGFNGMEFDTAVRHGINVVSILGNDAAWGIDRQIQLAVYGKPVATDLLPTRYDRVVEGLGGYGEHVSDPEELPAAIQRAFEANRPALLDVSIQRAISPRAEAAVARWSATTYQPF